MAKDDEILAVMKRMEERLAAAEARAEAAEKRLVSAGLVERQVPPMPAPVPRKFRFFNTQKWAWEVVESNRFRIVEPRWLRYTLNTREIPHLVEASDRKPAIVEMPDGSWLDAGFQPEAEAYVPPGPIHPGAVPGGEKKGTSADFFGIAQDLNEGATGGRAADQQV